MCGIFGIVTKNEQNLGTILVDAARRLTYRGYDSVGAATITNGSIDLRKDVKQDLPEGVIPFVYAPGQNTVNPDNMDGIALFDNTPGNGWPGAQFRVKVSAVGAVGNGPRIQYYTVYETESGFTSL